MNIPENKKLNFILAACIVANLLIGARVYWVFVSRAGYYFLDVGQGDSELVVLPDGYGNEIKILIDGGRDKRVMRELEEVLGSDRDIDIVAMTHPQLDHFGGLIDVLRHYRVGIFISTGRKGEIIAFHDLERVITEQQIRTVILREGDRIMYGSNSINVFGPSPSELKGKELNDSSLVLMIESDDVRSVYTGDIGERTEKRLLSKYNMNAAILKVGHHGSRYSSTASFLNVVSPRVAVIEVGKNTYGHPTKQTLERLEATGTKIYRTDVDGTVQIKKAGTQLVGLRRK